MRASWRSSRDWSPWSGWPPPSTWGRSGTSSTGPSVGWSPDRADGSW